MKIKIMSVEPPGGTILVLCQIALLVLYYGNIMPTLPLWVVWFPALCFLAVLTFVAILLIGGFVVFVLFGVVYILGEKE
jgi:hypothetical protein